MEGFIPIKLTLRTRWGRIRYAPRFFAKNWHVFRKLPFVSRFRCSCSWTWFYIKI